MTDQAKNTATMASTDWQDNWLRPQQNRANTAIAQTLETLLQALNNPRLTEALRYSVLQGGKRLRPILAFAAYNCVGNANGAGTAGLDKIAAALEFMHCYSLIHDDLPAMDDDSLRRGKATCHIAFDEATAILAGDALQAMAFETLSQMDDTDAKTRLALVQALAKASGPAGMVGGQMLDILAENRDAENRGPKKQTAQTPEILRLQLETLHRLKTGALIQAALSMGALQGQADESQLRALQEYGDCIGLAFQVADDILDVEGDTECLGKPQGADARQGKSTYPDLLGMDAAKRYAGELRTQAIDALADFTAAGEPLRHLAHYVIARQH